MMTTSPPPQSGPIPSSLAEERGCPSFWGHLPADVEPPTTALESHRGIADHIIKDYVCRTKLACTAWADASETDDEQPVTIEGRVESSYVAGKDLPFNHSSHDWIINVATSDEYLRFHSDKNPVNKRGERVMHCEWEIGALSRAFSYLPSAGDHVWVTGRWVFDCAHLENCKTEIHPPEALASWRSETFLDQSTGEAVAGLRISCVVSGDGGPCCQKDAVTGDYGFSVPIPESPSPGARFVMQHEDDGLSPTVELRTSSGTTFADVRLPFTKGQMFPPDTWVSNTWLGWSDPAHPVEYRMATVSLKSLRVLRTHDQRPVSEGEWNLWVNVNGRWQETMRNRKVALGEEVDLTGTAVPLVIGRPSSPDDVAVRMATTGWEGDLIDKMCGFGDVDDGQRGIPQLLDGVGIDQAKAWLIKQIDKLLNQPLTTLNASHPWAEMSGTQTITRRSDPPDRADFELTYEISVA